MPTKNTRRIIDIAIYNNPTIVFSVVLLYLFSGKLLLRSRRFTFDIFNLLLDGFFHPAIHTISRINWVPEKQVRLLIFWVIKYLWSYLIPGVIHHAVLLLVPITTR
jgi:hypothetical protein